MQRKKLRIPEDTQLGSLTDAIPPEGVYPPRKRLSTYAQSKAEELEMNRRAVILKTQEAALFVEPVASNGASSSGASIATTTATL
jgi:hypothetical protein